MATYSLWTNRASPSTSSPSTRRWTHRQAIATCPRRIGTMGASYSRFRRFPNSRCAKRRRRRHRHRRRRRLQHRPRPPTLRRFHPRLLRLYHPRHRRRNHPLDRPSPDTSAPTRSWPTLWPMATLFRWPTVDFTRPFTAEGEPMARCSARQPTVPSPSPVAQPTIRRLARATIPTCFPPSTSTGRTLPS